MTTIPAFSGSYAEEDVCFVLQTLAQFTPMDFAEKERLIQSGQVHYSQMLNPEALPTDEYQQWYAQALQRNFKILTTDIARLAQAIYGARGTQITLVSFARAGTPIGVLLRRAFLAWLGLEVAHYSISIVRDRGLDAAALQQILAHHTPESIVFVDGWTGKGTICAELTQSLAAFNAQYGYGLQPDLYVLNDLAGVAKAAGSYADYLIPSAVLNATVSGLISRTVIAANTGANAVHQCAFYAHWRAHDQSQAFVDALTPHLLPALKHGAAQAELNAARQQAQTLMAELIARCMRQFALSHVNFVKPGVCEATRALLRRDPSALLLKQADDPDVAHLLHLAKQRNVPVYCDDSLHAKAVAIIKDLKDA